MLGLGKGRATVGSIFIGGMREARARVVITSAQLLALFVTPVVLLPAPGANLALIIDWIAFEMICTSTAYAAGGVVSVVYHGGVAAHAGSVPAAVVNGSVGTVVTQLGPSVGANGLTVPVNTGLDLSNATQAFTTGTGTAVVHIAYGTITG